jgi:hypothetical protein
MLRGKEIPPLSAPQTLWQRPVPLEPGLFYHFSLRCQKLFKIVIKLSFLRFPVLDSFLILLLSYRKEIL